MDNRGLTVQLLALPQDQFEFILDLYRVYGSTAVGGILTAVAELRYDPAHEATRQHGVRLFHPNCAGCMAVAETMIGKNQ